MTTYILTRGAHFQYCTALRPGSPTTWCRVPLPQLARTTVEPRDDQKCRGCARELAWAARRGPTRDLKRGAA